MTRLIPILLSLLLASCAHDVRHTGTSATPGTVELRGLSAGAFNPSNWDAANLHFLPDQRSPLLEPLPGPFRNIYAPSIVPLPDGTYRIFYGGWDGAPTGNDRIYSILTKDFIHFHGRRLIIDHGPFQHLCNVSAVLNPDLSFTLLCTAYPDPAGLNKPATFHLPPTAATRPLVPTAANLISIDGYPNYAAGDLNGLNPLLLDSSTYHLYFANFRDFGHVYRASSPDAQHFSFDGPSLDFPAMPNDVKRIAGVTLLALHQNGPTLFYALSRDGLHFSPPHVLGQHTSAADQYTVAVGLVTRGNAVLGYLYGAGATPSLNHNRIFARWLQRRVVFVTNDGRRLEPTHAYGPDRALLDLPSPTTGHLELYFEDGTTPLRISTPLTLSPGSAYSLPR
jgi:hypothetical protein